MFNLLRNRNNALSPEDDAAIDEVLFANGQDETDPVTREERWIRHGAHVALMNHISMKRVFITQIMLTVHVALLSFLATKFDGTSVSFVVMISLLGIGLSFVTYKIISIHIDLSAAAVIVGEKMESHATIRPIQALSRTFEAIGNQNYFSLRRVEYWTVLTIFSLYLGAIAVKVAQLY